MFGFLWRWFGWDGSGSGVAPSRTVCAEPACAPRVAASASCDPRVLATASCRPRVTATADVAEC
jgi:hypothetical protein